MRNLSWSRIRGIMLQEAFVTRRNTSVWSDLLLMSTVSLLVFGFISIYLATSNKNASQYVVVGMVLWEVVRVNQYCVSVNTMWNVWSGNLTNIFITPISIPEFVIGNCLLALIKTSAIVTLGASVVAWAFHLNILSLGATLPVVIVVLTLFAWSVGWLVLGLIFRYGVSVQALAWGAITLVQPISAVYFPVHVLPQVLQWLAWLFPTTYGFEAARTTLAQHTTSWSLLMTGLALDVVWFVVGLAGFSMLFKRSRVTGQFARNDT